MSLMMICECLAHLQAKEHYSGGKMDTGLGVSDSDSTASSGGRCSVGMEE